ncbi:MAG TPA: ATP synthase F1 subunit delta [Firmicutes bacterium]|nr:ATP synthase F1 subunit delta [Bacillota bacterium]
MALKDRHANALLEISEENGSLAEDLEQAVFLRDVLDDGDIQAFLAHPHIPDAAKEEFFRSAFSGKISQHFMGFLQLMVRKSRERLIVPVLAEFIQRGNRRLGKLEAKVVSAKPLTEEQMASIKSILSKKVGMEVKVKPSVDPSVLGGFYILVGGRIFDRTVRSALNEMRQRLRLGGSG